MVHVGLFIYFANSLLVISIIIIPNKNWHQSIIRHYGACRLCAKLTKCRHSVLSFTNSSQVTTSNSTHSFLISCFHWFLVFPAVLYCWRYLHVFSFTSAIIHSLHTMCPVQFNSLVLIKSKIEVYYKVYGYNCYFKFSICFQVSQKLGQKFSSICCFQKPLI